MNLSKNQTIMCVIGGLAVVGTLVFGYLLFAASGEKSEAAEALELNRQDVETACSAAISPERASVVAIETNRVQLAAWRKEALALGAQGDRAHDATVSPAAFKQSMLTDARKLVALPGAVAGKIVKEDFAFGYADYIREGKIPDQAGLVKLQRRWGDIRQIVEVLGACGVNELVKLDVIVPKVVHEETNRFARPKKKGVVERPAFTRETYSLEVLAMPSALVALVNAFTTDSRFFVLETLAFGREKDELREKLGVEKDKSKAEGPRSSRRARRAAKEKEEEAVKQLKGTVVTSPESESPFKVTFTVSTYDFGSKEVQE